MPFTPFAPATPFGNHVVTPGVDVVGIPTAVGTLTAFDAVPSGDAPDDVVHRDHVLLIPGFTGSKEDFCTLIPLLTARGWRVVAYSQRGQADSVAPSGKHRYTIDSFVEDAVEVATLVSGDQPVHLVGHSFGGIIAQHAAIAHPTLFRSVTLLCSGPHGWPGRHAETTAIVVEGGSLGLWEHDNPGGLALSDAELGPEKAFLRKRAQATSSDNLLAGSHILRDQVDVTESLRHTAIPAHVAHGEFDDKWPISDQRDMAGRLGAEYSVIASAAHSPQSEAAEATAAAFDGFWAALR